MESTEGLVAPHIAIIEGVRGGRPHIAGRGVAVDFVAELHIDCGWPVRRICYEHDLTPAEVYSALAYFYDNREAILTRREADQRALDEAMAEAGPSKIDKIRELANG